MEAQARPDPGSPAARPARRVYLSAWLAAALVLCVLPVAAVLAWQAVHEVRADQARIDKELSQSALALSQSVERELASSFEALTVLSQSEVFQQARIAALGRLLHGKPRRDWDSIFVMDPEGHVVLDTAVPRPVGEGLQPLRELHARSLRQPGPAVSGGGGANHRGVAIALPVVQAQGGVRFVLGARLADDLWQRLVAGATLPAQGRAALFDAQGRLLALTGSDGVPSGAALPTEAMPAPGSAASGVERTTDLAGQPVYVAWFRLPTPQWIVRVSVPAGPVDQAHRQLLVHAALTQGGSLLLGLTLAAATLALALRRLRTS